MPQGLVVADFRIRCDCQSMVKLHLRGASHSVSLPSFSWSSKVLIALASFFVAGVIVEGTS
jgi:hypothetical protein